MNLKLSWPIIKWIDSNLGGRPIITLLQRGGKGQRGIPEKNLKYGSEEKGSSLYKRSILLGFILSKNLRGL